MLVKAGWFLGIGTVLAAGVAAYVYWGRVEEDRPAVTSAVVTRGDVVDTVEATGTLRAVTTVQVGTQVSGTIKALHADFNARVRRGQVIAELEPSLFEAQVEQARAALVRLEADARRAVVQSQDAQQKLGRARELSARALIPASDLETAETTARAAAAAVEAAEAQIVQAKASLHQSQVNLGHTIIRSPIDGVVISRNVDVGQTVAASMQAPTLFVLAQDLSAMQVNASVAESDIGRVQPGQHVAFRVDAYPGNVFTGTVSLVRLDPVVEQNVVSYVTTIDVPNPSLALKPGMTANVTIEIARASGVLRVPNAALRVRPTADELAALVLPAGGDSADAVPAGRDGRGDPLASGDHAGEVWMVRDGTLHRVPVVLGISDATHTAVRSGALDEGSDVVVGLSSSAAAAGRPAETTRSPLLPTPRRPTARRPGTP